MARMPENDIDIRSLIEGYLNREATIDDLRDWFFVNAANIEDPVVNQIGDAIFTYESGLQSEGWLDEQIELIRITL
jgi:hypothetical protein